MRPGRRGKTWLRSLLDTLLTGYPCRQSLPTSRQLWSAWWLQFKTNISA